MQTRVHEQATINYTEQDYVVSQFTTGHPWYSCPNNMLIAGFYKTQGTSISAIQRVEELSGPWDSIQVDPAAKVVTNHQISCPDKFFLVDL